MTDYRRRAGQMGGRATVARYGVEHMRAIGRKGARALHQKYSLTPVGQNDFALVERQTGTIKAYLSGKPLS